MNLSTAHTPEMEIPCPVRHAVAWVALCLALAVHVADEAITGFLSVYNPAVISIRERLQWAPLPTFTFEVWLGGLIVAVIVLSSLTMLVLRGARLMTPLSYAFGALMLGNGLLHIAGSLQLGRPMPGVYSAPLLLVASVYLLFTVNRFRRSKQR
jgi:Protein of unknown function with HXXEE motif